MGIYTSLSDQAMLVQLYVRHYGRGQTYSICFYNFEKAINKALINQMYINIHKNHNFYKRNFYREITVSSYLRRNGIINDIYL